MFGYNNSGITEGTHLSIRYPDKNSRIKSGTNSNYYWMRSTDVRVSVSTTFVWYIDDDGYSSSGFVCSSDYGIAPLIVLH